MYKRFLVAGLLMVAPFCVTATFPEVEYDEALADPETQRMALDMENASCEDLTALEPDVREAFLAAVMYLQRPGTLSQIIGPECNFLGETVEVAVIEDPTLTIHESRESLLYLPEMQVLLVTHKGNDAVAYGMMIDSALEDPVRYFLDRRLEAEKSASFARMFASTVGTLDPPPKITRELSTKIEMEQQPTIGDSEFVEGVIEDVEEEETEVSEDAEGAEEQETSETPLRQGFEGQAGEGGEEEVVEVVEEAEDALIGEEKEGSENTEVKLGPEPPPNAGAPSTNPLAIVALILFVIGGIILLVIAIKMRAKPSKAYLDK